MTADSGNGPIVRNSFTVDVEDWFHASALAPWVPRSQWGSQELRVERSVDRVLALLDDAGVTATFFVLGWIADCLPRLVGRISSLGHEVACHSYDHRRIYTLFRGEFREQLHRSLETLRECSGQEVVGHRAPDFSLPREHPEWVYEILAAEGVLYDSSVFPIHRNNYGNPDAPWVPFDVQTAYGTVRQFPLPVVSLFGLPVPFGGGGYFRLYPYALTRRMMHSANKCGREVTFYVHPWELDSHQPRQPVGLRTRLRHYHNLEKVEGRLRRLLAEFRFVTCRERLGSVEHTTRCAH